MRHESVLGSREERHTHRTSPSEAAYTSKQSRCCDSSLTSGIEIIVGHTSDNSISFPCLSCLDDIVLRSGELALLKAGSERSFGNSVAK